MGPVLQELKQYTSHSARTASPGQLVVMLYDGFLRFAGQAKAALEGGDPGLAGNRLTRAQNIVAELRVALDMSQGEISQNLASIYDYVNERLTAARLAQDPEPVTLAIGLMADLREAWAQVASTPRPEPTRSGPTVGVNLAG